jgi:hypothetical protein
VLSVSGSNVVIVADREAGSAPEPLDDPLDLIAAAVVVQARAVAPGTAEIRDVVGQREVRVHPLEPVGVGERRDHRVVLVGLRDAQRDDGELAHRQTVVRAIRAVAQDPPAQPEPCFAQRLRLDDDHRPIVRGRAA